jgi:uncharacterized integral membrane protein
MLPKLLQFIYKLALLIALLISFFIFINNTMFKHPEYKTMFSAWQFPMLLAVYIEAIYDL